MGIDSLNCLDKTIIGNRIVPMVLYIVEGVTYYKSCECGVVTHYEVYRATSSDGTYKKLTTTKELSYTAKSLSSGKKYYFKVRGYKNYKSGDTIQYNVYTDYSAVKYATAK